MAEQIGIHDTIDVLQRLGPLMDDIVLIGGQALNFWGERYAPSVEAVRAQEPFSSKDIDFCGTQHHVARCAAALGGRPVFQGVDARSLCIGVVHYVDVTGQERQLDFLQKPFGLESEDLLAMSLPAVVGAPPGPVASVRVMHPLHCLMSRVANVGGIEDKYRTPHGLRQLRASVACMRAYSSSLLDEGLVRPALKLQERVFQVSLLPHAQEVHRLFGIDVFDALLRDPRLPEAFERVRVPQMMAELAERRSRAEVVAGRLARSALSAPAKAAEGEFEVVGKADRQSGTVWSLRGLDGAVVERVGLVVPDKVPGVGDRVEVDAAGRVFVTRRARDRGR